MLWDVKRRQFVAGASATTAIALAGCSLLGGGGSSDSPEGVVEEAYDAVSNMDADAFESILHSESPERPVEDEQFNQDGQGEVEINLQNTNVTNDSPGEEDIRNEWGGSTGYTEEDVNTMVSIVDGADDAAMVEAEIEFTFSMNDQSQTETTTNVHLTATEDGSWTLVT